MIEDNRQHYQPATELWWIYHRVAFDHHDQMIYVTSLSARLRWRVPFRSPQ
jgi:hypothetical protein